MSNPPDSPPQRNGRAARKANATGSQVTLLTKWLLLQQAVADKRVSPVAANVMAVLLDRYDARTGLCFPSVEYLMPRVCRGRRTVCGAIAELVRTGWILRTRRPNTSNSYSFPFHKVQLVQIVVESEPKQPSAPIQAADAQIAACPDVQKPAPSGVQDPAPDTSHLESEHNNPVSNGGFGALDDYLKGRRH
jgi:hypothetical protein